MNQPVSNLLANRKSLFIFGTSPKLELTLNKCGYITALNDAYISGLANFSEMRRQINYSNILSTIDKTLLNYHVDKHLKIRFQMQKCIFKWKNLRRKSNNHIINQKDLYLNDFCYTDKKILLFDGKGYFQFKPYEIIRLYLQSIHETYKKGVDKCIVKNPYTITTFNSPQHFEILIQLRELNAKIPPLLLDFFENADRFDYFLARNCYSLEEKFRYDLFYSASAYTFLDLCHSFMSKYCIHKISRQGLFNMDANIVRQRFIHIMVHDHMQDLYIYRMNTHANITSNVIQFVYANRLLDY